MNLDPLEQRLQKQSPQLIPSKWKREILDHVMAQDAAAAESGWFKMLSDWFKPHRHVYAGLTAIWVLILVMRLSTPQEVSSLSLTQAPTSEQMARFMAHWQQYEHWEKFP